MEEEERGESRELDLDNLEDRLEEPQQDIKTTFIDPPEKKGLDYEQEKSEILKASKGPESLEQFKEIAKNVLDSKLAPRGVDTVEKVIVILETGKELGFTPMISLNNIHVIEGRPTLGIHMVAALLKKVGVDYNTLEDYAPVVKLIEGVEKVVDYRTTIMFYRKGATGRIIEEKVSFTFKEAVQAGLATKTNWKSYPKAMTWNRCLVLGARRVAPDAILGMYEMSEIADVFDVPYTVEEV